MGKIDRMEGQIAELRAQQDDDRRKLNQLEPARVHINSIRKPVLAKLAHSTITENWPMDPLTVRNCFAHGG